MHFYLSMLCESDANMARSILFSWEHLHVSESYHWQAQNSLFKIRKSLLHETELSFYTIQASLDNSARRLRSQVELSNLYLFELRKIIDTWTETYFLMNASLEPVTLWKILKPEWAVERTLMLSKKYLRPRKVSCYDIIVRDAQNHFNSPSSFWTDWRWWIAQKNDSLSCYDLIDKLPVVSSFWTVWSSSALLTFMKRYLDTKLPQRWISSWAPVPWPLRSPN